MINEGEMVRKTVSLPASVWSAIEEVRWAGRVKSESEVIRQLVSDGFAMRALRRDAPDGP